MRLNFAALGAFAIAVGLLNFWLKPDWSDLAMAGSGLFLLVVHPIRVRRFREYDRQRRMERTFSDDDGA